jgi:hypothetical protein
MTARRGRRQWLADARSLMAQGKLDDAQRELETLAALQPEPAGVERLRGIVEYENSHMPEAEAVVYASGGTGPFGS